MNRHLYKILGISAKSSPAEIKKAYFNLAKKYHPDHNPKEQKKFQEIKRAYEALTKPQSKNRQIKNKDSLIQKKISKLEKNDQEEIIISAIFSLFLKVIWGGLGGLIFLSLIFVVKPSALLPFERNFFIYLGFCLGCLIVFFWKIPHYFIINSFLKKIVKKKLFFNGRAFFLFFCTLYTLSVLIRFLSSFFKVF